MKLVVWQPYFFPYLGYFQAIHLSDVFCFFDDVNFIKKGFIHRNSVEINGEPHRFTIPLKKASQNKRINEVYVSDDIDQWKQGFMKMLRLNYGSTAYFEVVGDMVEEALAGQSISEIAERSVRLTSDYLGLETDFCRSSDLTYDRDGSAQEKMISLNQALSTNGSLNPIGGKELYDGKGFEAAGLDLRFFEPDVTAVKRVLDAPHTHLSILHWLFLRSPEEIRPSLEQVLLFGRDGQLIRPND